MKSIYAIHGAFSSPAIFNYLIDQFGPQYTWQFLDYHNETLGILDVIKNAKLVEPAHVVGHSMGGLIALGLINNEYVTSVTTIACPLGGIEISPMQKWYSRTSFVNDISSTGDFIKTIKNSVITKPVQHLISTCGFNPWMYEPNDGVIPIKSQRAYSLGSTHDISANHVEIMLCKDTVKLLQQFWD